jgi:hypothetical protein
MPPRARPQGSLTYEEIRAQLHYNQRTGWLTWRVSKPRVTLGMRAGSTHKKGHREITVCGKPYREHRVIWFWMTGEWPNEKYVDHKNHKRNDNRWCNLRKATHGQNYINSNTFGSMRGINVRGPSQFRVRSIVNGERKSYQVKTLIAAQRLRRKLEKQEWGEFACRR